MANFYTTIYDILGIVFGPILSFIYRLVGDNYGVAIIFFTLFCRLLMLPSSISQQKSMAKNQRMQLKMRKIQERYKGDRQRLQEETQSFYQREGYNPMSAGCSGGMLLQFPIIFGLISAIYRPLQYTLQIDKIQDGSLALLTQKAPEILKGMQGVTVGSSMLQLRILQHWDKFQDLVKGGSLQQAVLDSIHVFADRFTMFGMNLGATPKEGGRWYYYLIPVMAGVASMSTSLVSYVRSRKQNPEQSKNPMMGCMTFGMPLFSVFLSLSFPVGIGIYWIVSSLAMFLQMLVLNRTHSPRKMLAKVMIEETVTRRSRENSRKALAKSN
jgi:YidC/Oxa1 family membrane protein insertase